MGHRVEWNQGAPSIDGRTHWVLWCRQSSWPALALAAASEQAVELVLHVCPASLRTAQQCDQREPRARPHIPHLLRLRCGSITGRRKRACNRDDADGPSGSPCRGASRHGGPTVQQLVERPKPLASGRECCSYDAGNRQLGNHHQPRHCLWRWGRQPV